MGPRRQGVIVQVFGPLATHVGDQFGIPGSWLWLGPDLAVVAIWEMTRQMEDLSLFLLVGISK